MSDDKRRHERIPADTPVEIAKGEAALAGNLRDVSLGGAAIEFAPDLGKSSFVLNIGDDVALKSGQPDPVTGKVVRREESGIAMQFDEETDLLKGE